MANTVEILEKNNALGVIFSNWKATDCSGQHFKCVLTCDILVQVIAYICNKVY